MWMDAGGLTALCSVRVVLLPLSQLFQFRFPKFTSSVYYDPLIGGLTEAGRVTNNNPGGGEPGGGGLSALQIGLIAGIGGAVALAAVGGAIYHFKCRSKTRV